MLENKMCPACAQDVPSMCPICAKCAPRAPRMHPAIVHGCAQRAQNALRAGCTQGAQDVFSMHPGCAQGAQDATSMRPGCAQELSSMRAGCIWCTPRVPKMRLACDRDATPAQQMLVCRAASWVDMGSQWHIELRVCGYIRFLRRGWVCEPPKHS